MTSADIAHFASNDVLWAFFIFGAEMDEIEWLIELDEDELRDTELLEQRLVIAGIDPTQGYIIRKQGDVYMVAGME